MKKIALATLLFILTALPVQAQATLKLAVVQYETRADLEILFDTSTRVIDYLEGSDIEGPLFVALITEDQQSILTSRGLRPEILDESADMSRYVYLYNREPGTASSLSHLGDIFALSPHHALVRLSPGETFDPSSAGGGFQIVPIPENVKKPAMQTKRTQSETADIQAQDGAARNIYQFIPIALVVIFLAVILSAVFVWRKKSSQAQSK